MSNGGNIVGGIIAMLLGIGLIIVGSLILGASSNVKTEKGSIEDSLMNVPKELGMGLVIIGFICFILGILFLAGII